MDRVGPYVIDRKLGTGGMGTVYLARHEETGRPAAVKVLPASLAREEGFLARFEREIAALRQIENPHVVKIYESGSVAVDGTDGGPAGEGQAYYYAMEYVEGETLLAKLRRERRLPWPVAIDYGVQICSALKAAHDAGIVHRDIKPSNLLVSNEGTVKLADFGVAQVFASTRLTKTGGIIGTAEFMSPEQAQGQRATKKSDLYSLGAVLYTMLTGKPPYSGQTMLDVLHKHRFGQYDRPRHYAPECPSWLEEIVVQLLEKDPEKRPADAYVTGKRLREVLKKVDLSQSQPLPAQMTPPPPAGPPTGQEILSADDAAAHHSEYAGDAPTRTAFGSTARDTPSPARGPGEATIMHSLMREEIARQQQPHPALKFFENTWVLVGLLALLLVGGWFWWKNLPTPESRLAEADRLIAAGDFSAARIDHLKPLLDDPKWAPEAQRRLDEIDRRKALATSPDAAPKNAAEIEAARLVGLAEHLREAGENDAAVRTLEALLASSEGQKSLGVVRARAKVLLRQWNDPAAGAGRKVFIESALRQAASLAKEGKSAEATSIYRGLLTLYGDDPAAAEALKPAREAVAERSPQ